MTELENEQLNQKILELPGWFNNVDIVIFDFIFKALQNFNITGHCIEAGVFKGKSLSKISQAINTNLGERLLAIDISFNSEANRLFDIKNNIRLASPNFNLSCVKFINSSTDKIMNYPEINEFYKSTKFIHLDAGHAGIDVYNDLEFAHYIGNNTTILVIDDWSNPVYPHLQEAYYKYQTLHPDSFVPFLITPSKCYLCKPSKHHDWMWKVCSEFIEFLKTTEERKRILYGWNLIKTMRYLTYDTYVLMNLIYSLNYDDQGIQIVHKVDNIK